jgi:hypothetical protein
VRFVFIYLYVYGFLTVLSLIQTFQRRMIGWSRNKEVERIWKEVIVALFRVLFWNLSGGLRKTSFQFFSMHSHLVKY